MLLVLLIGLQAFHVAFLWLHDWLPVRPLNDVRALRATESSRRLALVTLIQSLPFTFGLLISLMGWSRGFAPWTWWWLWISYSLLFVGELRAWWLPYLVWYEPARAARYKALFGSTHAFLPERHGIRPNSLHVVLHAATAATLIVMAFLTLF